MEYLKDKSLIILLLIFIGCQEKIIIEQGNELVLSDIFENKLFIKGEAKEEVLELFEKHSLLESEDLWFYIDRSFYKEVEFDTMYTDIKQVSDSLAILWVNESKSEKREFIADTSLGIQFVKWSMFLTYDEERNKILEYKYHK